MLLTNILAVAALALGASAQWFLKDCPDDCRRMRCDAVFEGGSGLNNPARIIADMKAAAMSGQIGIANKQGIRPEKEHLNPATTPANTRTYYRGPWVTVRVLRARKELVEHRLNRYYAAGEREVTGTFDMPGIRGVVKATLTNCVQESEGKFYLGRKRGRDWYNGVCCHD